MFHYQKRGKYNKASKCIECSKNNRRKYYNTIMGKQKLQQYRDANKEARNAGARKKYEILEVKLAKKQYRLLNSDKINAYHKKYRAANKEKVLAKNRRRKALKRNLDQNYSAKDAETTKQAFSNICARCNNTDKLHIDHHHPLSKGNPLSLSNAVLLCEHCNTSKGSKNPEDFYTKSEIKKINKVLSCLVIKFPQR